MALDELGLRTRDALLAGLPTRRASLLLFAIERRVARLATRAHRAAAWYLTEETLSEREHALSAHRGAPALRRSPGLDVPQAHRPQNRQLLGAISASAAGWRERLHRAMARVGGWIERLPPFWIVFALTLTEMVGTTILALPIALAGVGPLVGVALLLILGLANILTIVAVSEVVTRNGNVRYGQAFFGGIVADYLGRAGSLILTPALLSLIFLALMAFYVGVATTLADATGVRAEVWAAALFLVDLSVLRRQSLNATAASALLIGAVNIGLILILSLLALPHVRMENMLYVNLPLLDGRPFDTSILTLIFGVIMAAYFGHISTGNCARLVLQRDPSGRALIRGNIAALVVALLIYSLWVIAVNGAIAPSVLAGQSGTILPPLAAEVGPIVYPFGLVFVVLGMGLTSVHFAQALFNRMREWFPAPSDPAGRTAPGAGLLGRVRAAALGRREHFALCVAPVAALFLVIEWLLLTGQESFAGPLSFLGALAVPLIGGIFPMLMLAASRRKGDLVPGVAFRFLGHPLVVGGVYLLFLVSIFLHGALIWQDPAQRLAALFVGVAVLGMTFLCLRRGMLAPRIVVELRVERSAGERATFSVVASGRPVPADVCLQYDGGAQQSTAASGEVRAFASLQSLTFQLPATAARELKVWAHAISPDGSSEMLPVCLDVQAGAQAHRIDLRSCGGQAIVPLTGTPGAVQVTLSRSEALPARQDHGNLRIPTSPARRLNSSMARLSSPKSELAEV